MAVAQRGFWIWYWMAVLLLSAFGGCDANAQPSGAAASRVAAAATSQAPVPVDQGYKLGSGDKLRVVVFGEDDLSGEFVVDGSGFLRFPLIGQIRASGETLHEFETDIEMKLKDGYLKDPRVNVEILTYRPFYIIGEVRSPGQYSYVNGMSLLNAIALAGGYTPRANDRQVYVRRDGSSRETQVMADSTTKIFPGDIIRVAERFF